MKNAVYFPTINIEQSQWLANAILYHDHIYTIMPNSFVENPKYIDPNLAEFMRENHGLIQPTIPYESPSLTEVSKNFLEELIQNQKQGTLVNNYIHSKNYTTVDSFTLHSDKVFDFELKDFLIEHKLMYKNESDLKFYTHPEIAKKYMYLLALTIANEKNGVPITHDDKLFNDVLSSNTIGNSFPININTIQCQKATLDGIMPTFKSIPDFRQLARFKEKNFDNLVKFRKLIDDKTQDIIDSKEELRDIVREKKYEEIYEERKRLDEIFTLSFGAGNIIFSSIAMYLTVDFTEQTDPSSIELSANTGLGIGVSLIGKAMKQRKDLNKNSLAYIFKLQSKFNDLDIKYPLV